MMHDQSKYAQEKTMNICVTGGAGFIGSHMVQKLNRIKRQGVRIGHIVVYDKLTYAGDLNRLQDFEYEFVRGDILDYDLFYTTLVKYEISHVIHFAAESHVDRSLIDPMGFLRTNVLGTAKVLEAITSYWSKEMRNECETLYIHISTDEVYGYTVEPALESSGLNPGNPYAASKAAADMLVIAQINSGNLPAVILRSSNNYGPGQNSEKLIPKLMEQMMSHMPLTIYGDGHQKRCWIHVEDYASIIWGIMEKPWIGEILNITGPDVYTNLDLAQRMRIIYADKQKVALNSVSKIAFVEDRKAHDYFYNVSNCKWELYLETLEMDAFVSKKKSFKRLQDFFDESFERLKNK